jgi:phosphoribosylanthranilate isomerase
MLNSHTFIKICGLTREQDVDTAVENGVNAIGFVLYPKSARYVSVERAASLAKRLPAFVSPVLLFVNADAPSIEHALESVPGAWIQFHGDESAQFCSETAAKLKARWMRAIRIGSEHETQAFDLVKYANDYQSAHALLLDAHVQGYGGGGQTFNWSQITQNVNAHLVLSGGLTAANVASGIAHFKSIGRSLGVDVSSGVEQDKGIKDPNKIKAFVQAVRS